MKLLLVDDESKLVAALSCLLCKNGFHVDSAANGDIGIEMACKGIYDIIILDRMLPNHDGILLLRELRNKGHETPVLFLTARVTASDRIEGLDAGADDYLTKPFTIEELLARLRALSRRKDKKLVGTTINAAGLVLDPQRGEVVKGAETFQLTAKESLLLELLMRNYSQVVTKEHILKKVWGLSSRTALANVDLYIHYLRKKLNILGIKTLRGIGYSLQEDINVSKPTCG
ncbi:response regulator transcription factor [Sporomusa sp.]|uniref:response regulator transcription factor n=1 Tax=Sporomusa sp. TaxID=2078658 RepID=UPI002BB920C8|nr:response regulator transcription factor [Sporomusa sp.]HWR44470.1 response regulator transcription factor [Sporomusa sp.]